MNPEAVFLCTSDALTERGHGVRFVVPQAQGTQQQAFAVRYQGTVVAYLNRCAHLPQELDWNAGDFFDEEGQYLVCAGHGALYSPASGLCVAGPCRGASLVRLPVQETAQGVFWMMPQISWPTS
jgi:nitrite reductase/ring-hydroxylating ferredoxin subunit